MMCMLKRCRKQAEQLVHNLLPNYQDALRKAPTSYRANSAAHHQTVRFNPRVHAVHGYDNGQRWALRFSTHL